MKSSVITLAMLMTATVVFAQPGLSVHVISPAPSSDWTFAGTTADPVELALESGTEAAFSWSTDVWSEFRVGWDLIDPDDAADPGWTTSGFSPLLTSAARNFTSGVHTFTLAARDAGGGLTRGQFILQVIPNVPVQADSWAGVQLRYR